MCYNGNGKWHKNLEAINQNTELPIILAFLKIDAYFQKIYSFFKSLAFL